MNRSPAEVRDRWLNYGRRYARYPMLWDSSLAFASGPLAPEAGTMQDYSGRTGGAVWSVGAGDVPKYVQGSVRGGSFWAGQYDGTHDYANCGTSSAFSFTDGGVDMPFTISAWAYGTGAAITRTILNKYDAGNNRREWYYRMNISGGVSALFAQAGNVGNRISINSSFVGLIGWHHTCLTYDGSVSQLGLNLAIDGTIDSAAIKNSVGTYPGFTATSAPLLIGSELVTGSGVANQFDDGICSVSIFRGRILTPSEIAILASHPLAAFEVQVPKYWSFATAAGGTHLWPWQIRRSRRVRGHR